METNVQAQKKEIASFTFLPLLRRLASRFSIKQIFAFTFMIQYVLVTGIIAGLLIYGGQQAVSAILAEIRRDALERVRGQLAYHMNAPQQLNSLNAGAWATGLLDLSEPASRERHFANYIKAFPDVAMTFVGMTDGSFYGSRRKENGEIQIVRNNRETEGASWYYSTNEYGDAIQKQEVFPKFDPRVRPWFESAQKAGGPVFSSVYRHFVFREPTISAAYPVYDKEGALVGVFGVDYLLSWLGNMLREIPVGPLGQIFITDAGGYLVATSAPAELFKEKSGQIQRIRSIDAANPVLRLTAQTFADGQGNFHEFTFDNRSYLADRKTFSSNGVDWSIYVVLASDDYLGGFKKNVYWTIGFTLLIIFMGFYIVKATTNWVTKPILRLNAAAYQLSHGQLQAVPDIYRQDELGQLSRSFNSMAGRITDLVEGLEARVEERTKALEEKTNEEKRLREILHTELKKAGKEQRALLPSDLEHARATIKIVYEPYMFVSGDFCGYHWMQGDDVLFGYLVDVTGHGVATAMQTAAINVMVLETARAGLSLPEIMNELNRRVGAYLRDDMMVAACCFELDMKRREFRYVAAGITEMFADAAAASGRIKTPGSFLGVSGRPEFEVSVFPVQEGDILCLYSDGVADILTEGSILPVNAGFEEFVQAVKRTAVKGAGRDDATAICIKVGA